MVTVPSFLLRRLYVRGSLRNTDPGMQFQLLNKLGAGYARKLFPLVVDGQDVPMDRCTFSMNGTPVPFERFQDYLPLADLVVGCAGGGELLDTDIVKPAMAERRGEPVFFIDLAVPRNFNAAVNGLDNVYLYDIDDLAEVADENLEERRRDAVEGEAIVEEEVESFWRWLETLEVEPTIVDLRDLAESIRAEETERTLKRISGLDDEGRTSIDQMTRSIVNKLLHQPTAVLKEDAHTGAAGGLVGAARRLFGLGPKK